MWKLAIKNLKRNKKRSFLTILSVFSAALIVGLAQGWISGLMDFYIDMFIKNQTGLVRIASDEFIKRERFMPVEENIQDADILVDELKKIPGVTTVEPRVRFGILLSNGENTIESLGVGLNLAENRYNLKEKMVEGSLGNSGIYIGQGLAKRLGIKQGQDLLIASKTAQGGLNGIKLRVEGIFKLGNSFFDRKFFFISLIDARRLLKMHNGATEILVYGNDREKVDLLMESIMKVIPAGVRAQAYTEQIGALYGMLKGMKFMFVFFGGLILFLASFVIVNTMMMNIFERIRELGTMKALGMTDREVFWSLTLEGAIMGAIGGVLGAVIGYLSLAVINLTGGVNLETMMKSIEMPFDYIMYPSLNFLSLLGAVVLCIIVPAIAAMIPARYSNKLMPADALRK
jgi:putative ABC transport system permease protein